MIKDSELPSLGVFLDMSEICSKGSSGGKLWILWQQTLTVSVISFGAQWCNLSIKQSSYHLYGSFVYEKCTMTERRELWDALDNFGGSLNELWFIAGGFNTVTLADERIGCRSSQGSVRDFNNFILGSGLIDAGYNGNKFTWSKREHGLDTKWA